MDLYSELTAKYQTVPAIATEIINLEAILNLPKPTEAFMSDIHGEYNAFQHVLRNGSGNVKSKIRSCFRDEMTEATLQRFAFWCTIRLSEWRRFIGRWQGMTCNSGI